MVSIANDLTMVDLMFGLYSKSSEKKKNKGDIRKS